MKLKILFYLMLSLSLYLSFSAATAQEKDSDQETLVHLPDGTEITIIKDKAYYECKGKVVLLPDGRYLLADGSKLTIKKSKITEFRD